MGGDEVAGTAGRPLLGRVWLQRGGGEKVAAAGGSEVRDGSPSKSRRL